MSRTAAAGNASAAPDKQTEAADSSVDALPDKEWCDGDLVTVAASNSLAADLGRRLTAPLTRANVKRCRKKLAKMELSADKNSLASLLGSSSTCELYSSSDGSSLLGGNEQRQLISIKKVPKRARPTNANTKAYSPPKLYAVDGQQQQQPHDQAPKQEISMSVKITESTARGRRSRKRMHFLRRSTSRFSSKSAPG